MCLVLALHVWFQLFNSGYWGHNATQNKNNENNRSPTQPLSMPFLYKLFLLVINIDMRSWIHGVQVMVRSTFETSRGLLKSDCSTGWKVVLVQINKAASYLGLPGCVLLLCFDCLVHFCSLLPLSTAFASGCGKFRVTT